MTVHKRAVDLLGRIRPGQTPTTVLHYLYFEDGTQADACAIELRRAGYSAEGGRAADEVSFLVVVREHAAPTPAYFATRRITLSGIAQRHRGDYDGWEAAVDDE
jgi:hypothetical protein